jgi:hypothetical protein
MRRPPICIAVLGLTAIALALPGFASAAPVVTFKAKAVPIKGFPHTGNILGAGAAVQAEYTISGTEYGGYPPPVEGINFYLPKGSVLTPKGFPTCPLSTLEPTGPGPKGCPKGSQAGSVGVVHAQVAFGLRIVPETATLESFYAPGGGLEFFTYGHEPTILEIISKAHYVNSSGLYGKNLIAEVPLVETVPGANDASITSMSFKIGSAFTSRGSTIYYYRLPKACPKGGLASKLELRFAGVGGLEPRTVSTRYNMPCPAGAVETPEPPPTEVPGTGGVITAPSNSRCVSRRNFVVHVIQIKGVRYRRVEAAVNGRRLAVISGSRTHARVDLKGLPKGTYTLRITATTTNGHTISGTRTYHTCVRKRTAHGNPIL